MRILPVKNTIMNSMTYVLYSEGVDYCVLIDCGEYETLEPVLTSIGKRVVAVLLTHGHSDHIYGLPKLIEVHPDVEICTLECGHEIIKDSRKNMSLYHGTAFTVDCYRERILRDGETIHYDGLADIDVIATPGHNESCLTYKIGMYLFTGDAYIPGVNVFSKFPGGNKQQAEASQEQLMKMEKEGCKVYCGHHV